MKVLGAKEARQNFAAMLDAVVEDSEETIIHRAGGKGDVVVVSLDDWNAIKETEYLLRNPRNAAVLRARIADMDAGMGEQHELMNPDAVGDRDIA